jgi:long-chain acyl-CoA synthetase
VENVCVCAFPEKAKPIAVVVPVEKTLRLLVEKNNIANKYSDLPDLVKLQSVRDLVMNDMIASGKAAGLQGIELVSGIVLASDIWTPENVSPPTLE